MSNSSGRVMSVVRICYNMPESMSPGHVYEQAWVDDHTRSFVEMLRRMQLTYASFPDYIWEEAQGLGDVCMEYINITSPIIEAMVEQRYDNFDLRSVGFFGNRSYAARRLYENAGGQANCEFLNGQPLSVFDRNWINRDRDSWDPLQTCAHDYAIWKIKTMV